MVRLWIFIFLFFLSFVLNGQFYSTGQAPSSIKWKQINTNKFQLIYPEEFYDEANRAANILELIYNKVTADYNKSPKKISVILHNRSVISNAYVTWAPRRSEWVTTPPSDNDVMDWLEHLALHEYRHVVQLTNLEQGLTKVMKFLIGEAATGAVAGLLPLWYYEGDAVLSETAFSLTGRGRSPNFNLELRAIEGKGIKRYSYDQSYLGSYKYHIPNHYKYGYHMVSYAHLKYGTGFWPNTINTVAKNSFSIAPFYWGLRKYGGTSKVKLYQAAMDSLKLVWAQNNEINFTIASGIVVPSTKHYASYTYVQAYKDGYFAVKSGINDITRFVYLHNGTEEILHTPGRYYNSRVDVKENYACWTEYIPDKRWQQQSYSCIKLLNLDSRKETTLKSKTRWFSPSISPSGNRLACLQVDRLNKYSIQIVAIPNAEILNEIPLNDVKQVFSPVWVSDSTLAYITLNNEGKSIEQVSLHTSETEVLFESDWNNIENLAFVNGNLLFSLDKEKARNVYSINLKDGTVNRVTNEVYGADFASRSHKYGEITYSKYTHQGYKPVQINIDSIDLIPETNIETYIHPWANKLSKQAEFNIQQTDVPRTEHPEKPYRKLTHGINIHSWAPFYIDPDNVEVGTVPIAPGVMLFSQNKLSTLSSIVSFYKQNGSYYFEPQISFEGLYPIIDITAQIGFTPYILSWPKNLAWQSNLQDGKSIRVRSYVPLNFTSNKYNRLVQPEVYYRYLHSYYNLNEELALGIGYLGYRLVAYNLLKKSQRDIQPRFGQLIDITFYQSPQKPNYFLSGFMADYKQYLPGIFKHHSILANFQLEQNQRDKQPFYRNRIALPRGYFIKGNYIYQMKFTSEYTMPLFYPDWSIGPFMYIKRFSITAHYDFSEISYQPHDKNSSSSVYEQFYSTGLILSSDVHFLRFFVPFTPSLRVSWLPISGNVDIGFGMNIQF